MRRKLILSLFIAFSATAQSPKPTMDDLVALNQRMKEAWTAGDYQAAIPLLDELRTGAIAIGEERLLPQIDFLLGRALASTGQPAEATAAIDRAVSLGLGTYLSIRYDEHLGVLIDHPDFNAVLENLRRRQRIDWSEEDEVLPPPYSDPGAHPMHQRLREEQWLTELVSAAATDLDRVRLLTRWAHQRFDHDPVHAADSENPLVILEAAANGGTFRCYEFAVLTAAAAQAIDLPARVLSIAVREVETTKQAAGHVVAEVWLRDEKRWVLADGQFDVVPVANGRALSAVELQEVMLNDPDSITCGDLTQKNCRSWLQFIEPYLYHFMYRAGDSFYDDDDPRPVMLLPASSPCPTTFQGNENPYRHMHCVSSPASFYAPPLQ